MKKVQFSEHGCIYTPDDIEQVLKLALNNKNLLGNSKGVYYYNVPVSFDIETTSFYRDEFGTQYDYKQVCEIQEHTHKKVKFEKCATMYVWQMGINGHIIIGRTWREFVNVCDTICRVLELNENRRMIVYVHNLAYEFQFIRTLFEWEKVFSIDLRKPIYAITKGFIEFRCSYLLSGYGLEKLGSQLQRYKVQKLVGGLDYTLLRHSQTELTQDEINYCVNDVRVVMAYIQEQIENEHGITNVPLTKTGYVRKYCRKQCLFRQVDGKRQQNYRYVDLMNELQITGIEEFEMLQRAFAGGFTHANGYYTDSVVNDVSSFDFTSSYPYVMVSEQFPMSKGVRVEVKNMRHFETLISKYCCIFDIEFNEIFASETQDNPISLSKCFVKENYVNNNGRLVCAKRVVLTITDIDFQVIKQFYTWKSLRVGVMYCYRRGYLPTEFVKSILNLYEKKTTLKGVQGLEQEYMNSKEMLNSCYGMTVTNPLRDEFTYNGVWDITQVTNDMKEELIYRYNTSRNRFLFYPWGVFVTAYARRNLFTAIHTCKKDYIYSDTDSVKITNASDYSDYFDAYNAVVVDKLKRACKFHGIHFDLCRPKTIQGFEKMLGVWDYEGTYTRFKTLGAKRYMVEETGVLKADGKTYDVSLTVSGVNKRNAVPYLLDKFGQQGVFDAFTNYLEIPPEATGKNIHTYIDYEISGELLDYTGRLCKYRETSGVHLEPTGYSLSLSLMYLNYLRGIHLTDK